MSSREVGIEQARKALGDLANEVRYSGTDVILTRNGKPVARIAPLEEIANVTRTLGTIPMYADNPHVRTILNILQEAGMKLADCGDLADEQSTGYFVKPIMPIGAGVDLLSITWLLNGAKTGMDLPYDQEEHLPPVVRLLRKHGWGFDPAPGLSLHVTPPPGTASGRR